MVLFLRYILKLKISIQVLINVYPKNLLRYNDLNIHYCYVKSSKPLFKNLWNDSWILLFVWQVIKNLSIFNKHCLSHLSVYNNTLCFIITNSFPLTDQANIIAALKNTEKNFKKRIVKLNGYSFNFLVSWYF